jgi:hypothetical protein
LASASDRTILLLDREVQLDGPLCDREVDDVGKCARDGNDSSNELRGRRGSNISRGLDGPMQATKPSRTLLVATRLIIGEMMSRSRMRGVQKPYVRKETTMLS